MAQRLSAVPATTAVTALGDLAPAEALRRLSLTLTRRVDGLLQGEHLAAPLGPGSELAESRSYVVGDDVRLMDWAATARTGDPHVRQTLAERELETWVLLDLSASMDFGTVQWEKRDLALSATAALGHLATRAGNRLGVSALVPGGVVRVPARAGRVGLTAALRTVLAQPRGTAGGPTAPALEEGLSRLGATLHRRGLVVVVSDFLGYDPASRVPPPWFTPLRRLAVRQQVLALEILDPRELELPDVGLLTVIDPETGRRREVATARRSLRERYAAAAKDQRAATAVALRRAGADHLVLRTDDDWLRVLAAHLTRARRLRLTQQPLPVGVRG